MLYITPGGNVIAVYNNETPRAGWRPLSTAAPIAPSPVPHDAPPCPSCGDAGCLAAREAQERMERQERAKLFKAFEAEKNAGFHRDLDFHSYSQIVESADREDARDQARRDTSTTRR